MIEKAIWTVIPNGIINSADGKKQLKFSVFISPRLNEGGITKEYLKAQIFPYSPTGQKHLRNDTRIRDFLSNLKPTRSHCRPFPTRIPGPQEKICGLPCLTPMFR